MQREASGSERRRHPRYTVSLSKRLSKIEVSPTEVLRGRTIDVSDGGVRMAFEGQVTLGQVLKCELVVWDFPVRIPTLTQVQWCWELSREYVCGLRFVI